MTLALAMALPLAAGLGAALLADRKGWAPPMWAALCTGALLRIVLMLLASQASAQPFDFNYDFKDAADAVRAGQNPVTSLREGGWHFLPFLAYVLAAQRELGELLGLPWNIAGRIVPVAADLALIPLVRRLAAKPGAGQLAQLRAFQYACAPIGLMVAGMHGQFPPIALLFGVGALLCARGGHVHRAGALIGLSAACATWSVLLLPGILLALPDTRRRLTVLGWTAVMPAMALVSSSVFLDTPVRELPDLAKKIMSTRPVAGDWGWSVLVTGGDQVESPLIGQIGTPVLLIALLAAGWWWRRADPIDLTLVLTLVFLIVTYRFGAQYLAWPLPYLIARPTRGAWLAITVASMWAAASYLRLTELAGMDWRDRHVLLAFCSLAVIPFLVSALPWQRRVAEVEEPPPPVLSAGSGSSVSRNGR